MVLEYLIKSAFVLTLMYGCFAWLLRRETFHRLNRILLLSILGASLLLPFVQIRPAIMLEVDTPTYLTQAMEFFATPATEQPEAPQVEESGSESPVTMSEESSAAPAPEHVGGSFLRHLNVRACLTGIYLLGLGVVLGRLLLELRQLIASLRGGMRLRDPSGATLVVRSASFPPYSFFRFIVVSVEDYEQNREPVLTHERAHVRLGHSWDILLLQVVQAVQWFNPFVWMMGQDLRALHEYEADEAVLNHGIDAMRYQQLLVTKAVGARLQTLSNSLSRHSLKQRFVMMHRKKSHAWSAAKSALLLPLMAFTLMAFAKPTYYICTPDDADKDSQTEKHIIPLVEGLSYAEQMERSKGRAVSPLIISPDVKNPKIRKRGNMYILRWTAGTWVVTNAGGSFIENHSENEIGLPAEKVTMMLDGEPFDFDHIPDIPASAIRKMERHHKGNGYGTVNLITSAVEVPDSVPGNVNPELSILITGVVPEGSYWRTSIYQKSGRNDSFDWHTYASYTTWTDRAENVRLHLRNVVCRPDHHVYVNVTRQGERHLHRLKDIMKECGVEHYTIRHESEM